jgi:adenine-specific DNA methylase
MDLAHSRPHREFTRAPIKPFNRFISAVHTVVSNCPKSGSGALGPSTVVKQGDARKLVIESDSIDLVLTSPPYLNAIDYMRCSKFSLVWMGHTVSELRQIRAVSVGTEASSEQALEATWVKSLIKQLGLKPALSNRHHALLAQYVWDMGQALVEVSRVLRAGGRAVYVVGDSTVRDTFIRNSTIVAAVAVECGLTLHSRQSRALPANRRYMPPPNRGGSTATMDARMRREVVLVFNKPWA